MAPANAPRPLDGRDHGHTYGDAYMHMPYRCRDCGAVEWIWNSRDGVTPFLVDCRECGGVAAHTMREVDGYERHHKARAGERIFVDATAEDSLRAAEVAFQRAKGTPYEIPEDAHAAWVQRTAAEIPTGSPKLVLVTNRRMRRSAKEARSDG